MLNAKENMPIIICGDWNLVVDCNIDTHGYLKENNAKARWEVLNVIEVLDLVDTWQFE